MSTDPSHRPAPTDVPVLDAITGRWSPRAFADVPVTDDQLRQVLEAARWAASSRNEQPWRFVVTRKTTEAHVRLAAFLNETNRRWAAEAPVLVFVFARETFTRNDAPNGHAWHDVGAACAQLAIQASALGLQVHAMAGLDRAGVEAALDVPAPYRCVTALALGVPGDPEALPEDLRSRETAQRARRPVSEWAFDGAWGAGLFASEERT